MLPEPPGPVCRADLGVDHQRPVPRSGQPGAHRVQVSQRADGQARAAEAARDLGEVGGREPDGAQRMPVRAEMMHLGPVRLVVVDHDQHGQAEPDDGFQLADAHQRAAVAERGHGQPVRPRDRRPDSGAEPEPDRLVGLGEAEAVRVRHRQVHARVAHEVARVHRDGALLGEQVVERDRQGTRIDGLAVALIRKRHIPPADFPAQPPPHPRRPAPAGPSFHDRGYLVVSWPHQITTIMKCPLPRRQQGGDGAGGRGDIAGDGHINGPVCAELRRVAVYLGDDRAGADQLPVPQCPHVQRAAPANHQVSAADQLGGQRRGKAAADIEIPGIAAEQALGRGRGGQQRPARVGQRLQVGPGPGDPGPAPGDEHRPPGPHQRINEGINGIRARSRTALRAGAARTVLAPTARTALPARRGRPHRARPSPHRAARRDPSWPFRGLLIAGAGQLPACTSSGSASSTVRRSPAAVR